MSVCPLDSFCLLVISACQSSGGMWLRASSAGRSLLSEPCNDVRKAFLCAFAARWQDQPIALHVNVHGRIDKREEVMTRTNTRETCGLNPSDRTKIEVNFSEMSYTRNQKRRRSD